MDHV
jgi:hypothetical protein